MQTRCPNCAVWFRVRAEHLSVANGYVTCGACDTVFNALASLTEESPPVLNANDPTSALPSETVPAANAFDAATDLSAPAAEPVVVATSGATPSFEPMVGEAPSAVPADAVDGAPNDADLDALATVPLSVDDTGLTADPVAPGSAGSDSAAEPLAEVSPDSSETSPDAAMFEAWMVPEGSADSAGQADIAPGSDTAQAATVADEAPLDAWMAPDYSAGPAAQPDFAPESDAAPSDTAMVEPPPDPDDSRFVLDAADLATTTTAPSIAPDPAETDSEPTAPPSYPRFDQGATAPLQENSFSPWSASAAPAEAAREVGEPGADTSVPEPGPEQMPATDPAPVEPPYARTLSAAEHAILFTEPGSAEEDVEDADDAEAPWQHPREIAAEASPEASPETSAAPAAAAADGVTLPDAPRAPADNEDQDEHTVPNAVPPVLEAELAALAGQASTPRLATKLWRAAAALLSLVLITQLLFMWRGDVIELWPASAPWFERVCAELDCREGPVTGGAVRLIARDIRDHPQYRDALLVNATVVNDADIAVPYPVIELRLHDADGHLLGARRFAPAEYLDHSIAIDAGMPSAQPIYVVMELGGNLAAANSFEFNFL